MDSSRNIYIGWAQALFSVLVLWGVSNVYMGYCTQILEINKVIFACTTFTSYSLCLLLYAGKGNLSKETLRSVDTWAYGIIMLINYFITLHLFSIVTATEASLLQRFSVIFSLFTSWMFLMRKPNKFQLLGVFAIAVGLLIICSALPDEKAVTVYVLMFLAGVFQSLRIFVAELHRPHKMAVQMNDIKSRCRVVGFIMFIISMIFVGITGGFAFLQSSVIAENRMLFLVQPEDFFHTTSILAGMIMGIFIYTPIRYLEFSSTHIIKTENYLTVTALSFLSTLFWEWLTIPLTGLSLKELSNNDIIAGIIITTGAIVMAISKIKQVAKNDTKLEDYLCVESQNPEQVKDSREILANTLEYFQGDINKTAKSLKIPSKIINTLLTDKDKVLAFKKDKLKDIERHYRKHVASVDPLTGLPNRGSFMAELRNNSYNGNTYSVLFIDLDKFKPVNDTYGHEAGDIVLKGVADRLQNLAPKGSIVTRLGGDEFCILLLKTNKEKASEYINEIKSSTTEPFEYEGQNIEIGASIGVATFPDDSDEPEELLKMADKGMYDDK